MSIFRTTVVLATIQAILVLASTAVSQSKSQEELKSLREQKLSKSWLKKANWLTDYDEARKQAEQEGKLIFAYFTRSYSP